ncbi:MAG: phosphate ABC transporter permease PstA [Verrucomicrobia bacterium]|nr:phosphate ABC transporter permease PstA [Verrucomicrobiota bacterium]
MAPLFKSKPTPPHGEPFVWLGAMGLAVGVIMVAGLFILILSNGLSVFWPARVVEFKLKDGSIVAGEIVREQVQAGGAKELQIHTGNKDVYGLAYRFVAETDIVSRSEPPGYLMVGRIEYGNAILQPVSLVLGDGTTVKADATTFDDRLQSLVKEAAARRRQIEKVEKVEIGAINRKMTASDVELRALERDSKLDAEHREKRKLAIKNSTATLQKEYETLAAQARDLRAAQNRDFLNYRLATGEERKESAGNLMMFYHPNSLGFFGRVEIFFSRIWEFLTEQPREANTEGGIFPAIFGTFVMTLMMCVLVTPFGVIAAIYLREYAKQGLIVRAVRISVNNLAGVPSIVFGVFGLGFFVYTLGAAVDQQLFSDALPTPTFGTGGIFWASLTLALLTLPVIIVATEEALVAVPRGIREAALAAGASKWQTIQRVVLPSATPGILTGVVLAMARGAGEVAPLMLVGVVKLAPSLPLDTVAPFFHLDRKFMHLGFHIYDLGFQSPDSDAAKPMVFATALLLILLVIVMNLAAILLRNRLRKRYAIGTF